MLLRKTDWHDLDGIRLLLDRGADPNAMTMWGKTALHNALLSDNRLEIIALLLERGADATIVAERAMRGSQARHEQTGVQLAAWRGRGDVLAILERRGVPLPVDGVDGLVAACARGDGDAAAAIAARSPESLATLRAMGGTLLGRFAGVDNADGVRCLLDLGVAVDAPFTDGEPYFGIPARSRALHVAAWRAAHETVPLLLARGAAPDEPDPAGETPLALAVRACVDSYWQARRSPASVRALLAAGSSPRGIALPTGYDEVDALLRRH